MTRDACKYILLLCAAIFLVGCRTSKSHQIRDDSVRAPSTLDEPKPPSPQKGTLLQEELEQERRKREAAEKLISELEDRLAAKAGSSGRASPDEQVRSVDSGDTKGLEETIKGLGRRLAAQTQLTQRAAALVASLQKQLGEERQARSRAEAALQKTRSNADRPQTNRKEAAGSVTPTGFDPRNVLSRVLILANDLYRDKRYSIASSLFRIAVDNGVKGGETYFRMGKCLAQLDKTDEAIEAYQSACECFETDPRLGGRREYHAYAYNSLGVLLRRKGEYTEAVEAYKKAVEIMPDYAGAFYNLGVLYYDFLNDSEQAAKNFRKHIDLGGEKARDAQRYLAQIEKNREK